MTVVLHDEKVVFRKLTKGRLIGAVIEAAAVHEGDIFVEQAEDGGAVYGRMSSNLVRHFAVRDMKERPLDPEQEYDEVRVTAEPWCAVDEATYCKMRGIESWDAFMQFCEALRLGVNNLRNQRTVSCMLLG